VPPAHAEHCEAPVAAYSPGPQVTQELF
jgi:hypothetical protein